MREKLKASIISQLKSGSPALLDLLRYHGDITAKGFVELGHYVDSRFDLEIMFKRVLDSRLCSDYEITFVDKKSKNYPTVLKERYDLSNSTIVSYLEERIECENNLIRFCLDHIQIQMDNDFKFHGIAHQKMKPIEFNIDALAFVDKTIKHESKMLLSNMYNAYDEHIDYYVLDIGFINQLVDLQSKFDIRNYGHEVIRDFLAENDGLYKSQPERILMLSIIELFERIFPTD